MDDLTQQLSTLRDKVVPAWGPARSERAYMELGRLRQRRRARNLSLTASLCALVLVVGMAYLLPHLGLVRVHGEQALAGSSVLPPAETVEVALQGQAVVHAGRPVKLADGSIAELSTPASQLSIDINQPDHVSLHLDAGSAHFEVVPNELRRFSVFADSVEIVVVGTAFDVERDNGRIRVAVTHGKVRVRSAAGTTFVRGGEARWFEDTTSRAARPARPPAQLAAAITPVSELRSPEASPPAGGDAARKPTSRRPHRAARAVAAPPARGPARAEWRSLNQSGYPEEAYRLLEHGASVPDDPEALMEAADAARLTNHPEMAVGYLQSVVRAHRDSPATPLAAFTLGRVLLERLGRPVEAAQAFATARELAPQGSLAQDALAREVESWSKAGHANLAYSRSLEFVLRYPSSRRARIVQRYGGITPPR